MAATTRGRQLTRTHQRLQRSVGGTTVRRVQETWRLLDPNDLDGSTDRWLRAAIPTVGHQRRMSAVLASRYVRQFRHAELPGVDPFTPSPALRFDARQVANSLTVTGPVTAKQYLGDGLPLSEAMRRAEASAAAAAIRHALDGGRDTIIGADDNLLLGHARVVGPTPCAFCAMLASRGPVYREEASATFEAHDSCQCTAEPVYRTDADWPDRSTEFRDLWDETTYDAGVGRDRFNAFRRAYERPHLHT